MVCYGSDKVSYSNQTSNGGPTSTEADLLPSVKELVPAFDKTVTVSRNGFRPLMNQAVRSWLCKTPSKHTRVNYRRDLGQFLHFTGVGADHFDGLLRVRPEHVAAWRDDMRQRGYTNATIRRKMTALRALFSYLQLYGYVGANPAHGKFVAAPAVARDGKTVGLSPSDCRRLLEAPDPATPMGVRDRAMLAVLAYSACRVGELVTLRIGDSRMSGEHRVLAIYGKGGKERTVPLHLEAVERLSAWIGIAGVGDDRQGPLFRPAATPRGGGHDGFIRTHLTTRAVENLVKKYVRLLGLDSAVTVHSLRVTALTTARE